jgi:Cd2+/Zn2+-exporting ATPase
VETIIAALNAKQLGASIKQASGGGGGDDDDDVKMSKENWAELLHAALVGLLTVVGYLVLSDPARTDSADHIFIASTSIGLVPVVWRCYEAAMRMSLDINVLVGTAVVGSLIGAAFADSALLISLVLVADVIETRVMLHVRRLLAPISTDIMGSTATLKSTETVSIDKLKRGDIFLVRMGEAVVCDGVVVKGSGVINESAFTGESEPVAKEVGDRALKGTVLENGYLEVEIGELGEQGGSMLDQLNRSVLEVQGQKGAYQRMTDTFAKYWTPSVIGLVLLIVLIGGASSGNWVEWQRRGLVLLVLSCPCAVVMAAPVVTSCAISKGVEWGVLIRGASAVEATGSVNVIALDKTGTLTSGFFSVNQAVVLGASRVSGSDVQKEEELEDLLRAAAGLEARSSHPLAHAVVRRYTGDCVAESDKALPEVRTFKALPGIGMEGWVEVDGDWAHVLIGNERILEDNGGTAAVDSDHAAELAAFVTTASRGKQQYLLLAVDDEVKLVLGLSDTLLPEAVGFVRSLRDQQLDVIMLTGDATEPALEVCHALKIPATHCHSRLLPDDKLRHVGNLQNNNRPNEPSKRVMMVGDGVNDAGALALATVGVAMGSGGAAIAISAADVVVMTKDISSLSKTISLCAAARKLIEQNIAFAVGVKLAAIIAALAGEMELWHAVIIDVGALVLVVTNGTRILQHDGVPAARATAPSMFKGSDTDTTARSVLLVGDQTSAMHDKL